MAIYEEITGVALLTPDGSLWSLPRPYRHHHIFALAAFTGKGVDPSTQGFTTTLGRFVDRQEAAKVAAQAGQHMRRGHDPVSTLYSEDLW